jgi:outer membrane protein OmpA-like peptidoglycan-associated protein
LDHSSSRGRGYNAGTVHAGDSGSLTADPSGASNQGGKTSKRKTRRVGPGGVAGESGAGDTADDDTAMGEGFAADDDEDSSLTDDGSGAGGPGSPGLGKRRGRGAGHAKGGAAGSSSDEADGIGSATGRTAMGEVPGASGKSKGKRGATARKRAGGAQGSNDGSTDMDEADDEDSDTRIAAVEVPGGRVEINEEYQPLTLGGALPVVLGVNEEGRFDFDQYALRDEVKAILDALAETLKSAEYDRLDIIGYTDRIGSVDYNQRLSELRAYAVAQYLMRKGVPEHKVRYEGRGDKDPLTLADECQGLAREDLIACLQRDRRVEIEASIHRKHATVQ